MANFTTLVLATYVSALIAGQMFWPCLPCHARNTDQNKAQSRKIQNKEAKATNPTTQQIDLGNQAGGWGYEPLEALSSAVDRHLGNRFVQITWVNIIGSLSATVTILYDRRFGTIKYFCYGGHNTAGDESDRIYAHYLYTGTTETLIRQAAQYEKSRDQGTESRYGQEPYPDAIQKAPTYNNAGTSGSYYDTLLLFGCHRIKLP